MTDEERIKKFLDGVTDPDPFDLAAAEAAAMDSVMEELVDATLIDADREIVTFRYKCFAVQIDADSTWSATPYKENDAWMDDQPEALGKGLASLRRWLNSLG